MSSLSRLQKFLKQAPPGPPPREGLKWKPSTHRWVKSEEVDEVEKSSLDIKFDFLLQNIQDSKTRDFIESIQKHYYNRGAISPKQEAAIDKIYYKLTGKKEDKPKPMAQAKQETVKNLADNMLRGEVSKGLTAKQVSYLKTMIHQNISDKGIRLGHSDVHPTWKTINFYINGENYHLGYWSRTGGGGRLINETLAEEKEREKKAEKIPARLKELKQFLASYGELESKEEQIPENLREGFLKDIEDAKERIQRQIKDIEAGYWPHEFEFE